MSIAWVLYACSGIWQWWFGKGNFWCPKWVRGFICSKITKHSYFWCWFWLRWESFFFSVKGFGFVFCLCLCADACSPTLSISVKLIVYFLGSKPWFVLTAVRSCVRIIGKLEQLTSWVAVAKLFHLYESTFFLFVKWS